MKSAVLLPLFLFSLGLLTSCSHESDDSAPVTPPSEPKKLEIKISPSLRESRATDYGFETGDCIGLYVVNYSGSTPGTLANSGNHVDNMRFRYNGEWIPDSPIFWADNETHADFYLYYPYNTNVQSVSNYSFSVKADQSAESAYKASDLMIGKTSNVAPSTATTVIPVNHVMSRVVITLEAGNGFTKESLAQSDVKVRINGVKRGASVNIATGEIHPAGEPAAITPFFTEGSYKALIVPQTVDEGSLITVTVDGRDYNLNKAFTFESAKSHKFTVTLSRTSNGVNVSINPWNEDDIDNGGTAE